MSSEQEDSRVYSVVVNQEGQYSIWLADSAVPEGWSQVGMQGSKAECLAHIATVWTDIRPLSLRKWLAERDEKQESGPG
jgi:MbtH protein